MAVLINGNGNPAIYPDQDADWFASIFGGQTAITGVGSQFAAEIQDANTIALADGVIITKEGRRIQLDANQSDIFDIPTGAQGTTNYYIIGYCLTTNDDSSQTAETFVQLMENATDTIEEDTFRDGADKVYVSLYRVTQTGFTLDTPELLLPTVSSITAISEDLTANNNKFIFAYDSTSQSYGYKAGGADTFHPFKPTKTQTITDSHTFGPYDYGTVTLTFNNLTQIVGITDMVYDINYCKIYEISINGNQLSYKGGAHVGGGGILTVEFTAIGY